MGAPKLVILSSAERVSEDARRDRPRDPPPHCGEGEGRVDYRQVV
jgi:hypothetical protein